MAWVEHAATGWRGVYRDAAGSKRSKRGFEYEYQALVWAESKEAAAFGQLDPHARPDPGMTLATYAQQQWLSRRTGLQPRSRSVYRRKAEIVAESPLGSIPLDELSSSDVERWFAAMDLDPAISVEQRNNRLKYLRMILKQAVLDRALVLSTDRPDPSVGVRLAKRAADLDDDLEDDLDDEPVGRWIPPESIELLLDAAAHPRWQHTNRMGPARMMFGDGQLELAILLGCEAGLRWGEWAALGRGSTRIVDGTIEVHVKRSLAEKGRIGPTKNGKPRWVPVSTRLADAITKQQRLARIAQRSLLIARLDGSPIRYNWSAEQLDHAARQAGIPLLAGWHDLRHTYGSVLADHDVPVQRIADLMGHSATDVTRLYVHRAPMSTLRAAVGAVFG